MARQIKITKSYRQEGFNAPVFEYRPDWPYLSVGFGDERDFFVENLSLLIASGMGITNALAALRSSVKSRKMKKAVAAIEEMIDLGFPLWQALEKTKILNRRLTALARAGEESGKLPEHLNLITVQQHKEKIFKSRLRAALIYPGIVLFLAIVIALGAVWKVLPPLAALFAETEAALPLSTRILIGTAGFFERYGIVAVPAIVATIMFLSWLLFFCKKTKFVGDAILFSIPGIGNLLKGVELARFGYVSGTLLQAGFPADRAFGSLAEGADYAAYRKFYDHLRDSIRQGHSFKAAFENYRPTGNYIPATIQQLIISAELSGRLPETLIKIGVIFEEKTEAMAQDLNSVLEPAVIIVVGLIVAFVISGIIGPIYALSSQI